MADQKQASKSIPLSHKNTCCHDCCTSLWRWDLILSNCVRLFYMHWAFQHINEGQWKRCLIIDRSLVCEQKQKTLTELHGHWACAPFRTLENICKVRFNSWFQIQSANRMPSYILNWNSKDSKILSSCTYHHVILNHMNFYFCGTQKTFWRLCCMQLQWMRTEAFKLQKGHKSRIKTVHSKSSEAIQ